MVNMSAPCQIFMTTYVEYSEGSIVSKLMAIATLLPVFAYAAILSTAVSLRATRGVSALVGLAMSHALNAVLKDCFAHARPEPLPGALHPLTTHGMPSNHAQQAAFLGAYLAANLLFTHPRRPRAHDGPVRLAERDLALVACMVYCVAVSFSRVYLGAHSVDQVVVGSVIGATTGLLWAKSEAFLFSCAGIEAFFHSPLALALRLQCAECSTPSVNLAKSNGYSVASHERLHAS